MAKKQNRCLVACLFLVGLILSGCLGQSDEVVGAERTLRVFFTQLSQAEYQKAAETYGGSYEILQSNNPDLDPGDYPALWERACTRNGFQCLAVEEVLEVEETGTDVYTVTVSFQTAAGELFQLGPCCGEDPAEEQTQTEFDFRVARDKEGRYRVLDLPVYVP